MKSSRHSSGRVLVGIVAIAFGVLLMLDNLGLAPTRDYLHFWPVVFILAGALKLLQSRSLEHTVLGVGLISVGALMTLDRLGLIHFNWRTMWPAVLIVVGLMIIARPRRDKTSLPMMAGELMASGETIDATALLGGFERSIQSNAFRGGEVTAIMGGCKLDLRQASFQGEAVLEMFAMWGGIEVKVPPDWTVVLEGTPILGGFVEKTAIPPDGAKRLIIKGYAIMGSVEVTN